MSAMPPPSSFMPIDADAELARCAAQGDVAAFEQLYRRHHRRVFGVIVRLVGQAGALAEDLTQDAFVRAWQALPGFRFDCAFSTWLYRLAVNTALMALRAQRGRPWHEDEAVLEAVPGHDTALANQQRHELEQAVATLPPRARAVLVLHDVEGWTHEEIASALDMAVGTSKAQLHRARSLLRARLGEP